MHNDTWTHRGPREGLTVGGVNVALRKRSWASVWLRLSSGSRRLERDRNTKQSRTSRGQRGGKDFYRFLRKITFFQQSKHSYFILKMLTFFLKSKIEEFCLSLNILYSPNVDFLRKTEFWLFLKLLSFSKNLQILTFFSQFLNSYFFHTILTFFLNLQILTFFYQNVDFFSEISR